MALILTDYDLSGGVQDSSEVVAPNNWRITATTTGCPALQYTRVDVYVEDEQGNWAIATDASGHAIHMTLKGNQSKSINPIVVNAANGLVTVRPPKESPSGVINVDSINA